MAYDGAIDLKKPEVALQYFEECMSKILIDGNPLISPRYRSSQKHEQDEGRGRWKVPALLLWSVGERIIVS